MTLPLTISASASARGSTRGANRDQCGPYPMPRSDNAFRVGGNVDDRSPPWRWRSTAAPPTRSCRRRAPDVKVVACRLRTLRRRFDIALMHPCCGGAVALPSWFHRAASRLSRTNQCIDGDFDRCRCQICYRLKNWVLTIPFTEFIGQGIDRSPFEFRFSKWSEPAQRGLKFRERLSRFNRSRRPVSRFILAKDVRIGDGLALAGEGGNALIVVRPQTPTIWSRHFTETESNDPVAIS